MCVCVLVTVSQGQWWGSVSVSSYRITSFS